MRQYRTGFLSIALAGALASGAPAGFAQDAPFDLVIRHGLVMDGTGAAAYPADIAVRDGRIAAVGALPNARADVVIDATGRIVAPGFIDLHSHADDERPGGLRSLDPRRRAAPNLVTQGVTTVVVNQDGRSPWPIAEQRAALERRGIGPNAMLLAGHGTIRSRIMGPDARRPATGEEVMAMRRLVRQALAEGAVGLSAGLEYEPGRWSTTGELIELVAEVAASGGVYIAHQRAEGRDPMWFLPSRDAPAPISLIGAVEETIEIGERTGATVVASHVKAKGVDMWGASDTVIALIRAARDRGVRIYGDTYPYTTSGSDGHARLVPAWAYTGAGAALATLRDPASSAALRLDMQHEIDRRGGADRIVVFGNADPGVVGRSLTELAARWGVPPVEAALRLQLAGYEARPGGARIRGFSMDEADVDRFMMEPWVATASDAGIALPADGPVHARFYGTFPRALGRTAVERGVVSLEHAVRSMTSLPAGILGLTDRGVVRAGYVADLVVVDPARVSDMATFAEPHVYARGIDHVLVGGVPVVTNGVPTWALAGTVLVPERRAASTP